ncbi:uncharacterized protein LOC110850331 [Folsomia candida]|uniref:Uncharacterized protein n=1 Tax=Folsomia candida TaxID=158441 RepID=A0A226EB36_FOLCA|nr:uncharacterized protein LOC110850331 [Folsomia candida]OXA54775.1 hypothetical protein Fcan01_10650 [Folsomia candida]
MQRIKPYSHRDDNKERSPLCSPCNLTFFLFMFLTGLFFFSCGVQPLSKNQESVKENEIVPPPRVVVVPAETPHGQETIYGNSNPQGFKNDISKQKANIKIVKTDSPTEYVERIYDEAVEKDSKKDSIISSTDNGVKQ